jgi:hypothetical protein
VNRIHTIEAADLAFICGRERARQSLADLAIEAFTDAARLYRVAGLSLMAAKAHRCIAAVLTTSSIESAVAS